MKKYRDLTVVLLCTFGICIGCDDTLVESPKSIIAPDDFFTTEKQAIQATNGVYSRLPTIFGQQDLWSLTFAGTDLFMFNGGSRAIRSVQRYDFSPSTANNSYDTWNRCYDAIKDANLVISRVAEAPIDEDIKNRLLGESKYLRALYYYILNNTFGAVPLWTDELDVDRVSELPRSSVEEVRSQIIQDLQEAEQGLPWSYDDPANTGRVTKGAALSLLAKAFLFNKDWENASLTARRVVNNGPYELLSEYEALFEKENENNEESIFEIQFKRDAANNQNFKVHYFYTWFFPLKDPSGSTYAGVDFGTTSLTSYHEFYPTEKVVNELYDSKDKRKEMVIAYGYDGQDFTSWPEDNKPWFGPKFWDLTANQRSSDDNLYFMRYADVILILAEAENELGQPGEAIKQLNKLRPRAGLPPLENTLTQNQIREYIMDERARELIGEFQRKWDLARWGTLVEEVQSINDDNPEGAQNVQPFHRYFPIPYDEIVKNPNLKPQNEGY